MRGNIIGRIQELTTLEFIQVQGEEMGWKSRYKVQKKKYRSRKFQDGNNGSGECKRKVTGLEEKFEIGCDGGRFPKCQPHQRDAFYLDDFIFCNSSKLETVGRQSERKSCQIKSNYEYSLISSFCCLAGKNMG